MRMVLAVMFLFMVSWITTRGQVPFPGGCPDVKVMQNFDVMKYLGLWYEHKRYFTIFEAGGICVTANYTDKGNGVVGVNNSEFNTLTNKSTSISGEARLVGQSGEGKLGVRFRSAGGFQAEYLIVGTDYTSYAIVWSCADIFFVGNLQFAWILTREKHPSNETLARIKHELQASQLSTKTFRKTPQTCSYN